MFSHHNLAASRGDHGRAAPEGPQADRKIRGAFSAVCANAVPFPRLCRAKIPAARTARLARQNFAGHCRYARRAEALSSFPTGIRVISLISVFDKFWAAPEGPPKGVTGWLFEGGADRSAAPSAGAVHPPPYAGGSSRTAGRRCAAATPGPAGTPARTLPETRRSPRAVPPGEPLVPLGSIFRRPAPASPGTPAAAAADRPPPRRGPAGP